MRSAIVLALTLAAAVEARAQVAPYTSYRKLSSTNGWSPIVYDIEARRIVSFREHLYRFPAPGQETRELAYDLYLGLRVNGASQWLTAVAPVRAGYELGTGLIRTEQEDRGIRVTTTYTAPFGLEAHAFLVVAEVENLGPDTTDVALFSLHNFHTGGGPNRTSAERIRWDAALGAYVESSSAPDAMRGVLLAKPLSPISGRTASPANPFPIVNDSGFFANVDDSGTFDDAVSGFQIDVEGRARFAQGARAWFAMVVALAPDGDAAALSAAIDTYAAGRTPAELLEGERAEWRDWHARGRWPVTLTAAEEDVARQSLAILRMGQVREPGTAHGGTVASLPPGQWDICWLRDGMLAVDAFTATGHHAEAEAALDFMIRGPFGDFESYIGRPYGLTLARYYGNGREESDFNANGPNIELDGFGMYLESAAAHVTAADRGAWLLDNRAHIDALVADVLVEARDAETRLITADSSIWETHWDNGGRQRWAFTSGRAARGLRDWANAIDAVTATTDARAATYRAAADELHQAMIDHLVDPASGAIASSVEQLRSPAGMFADAQAALVLREDLFAPGGATGLATLDFLRDRLFLSSTTRRGYRRNDDGDTYDRREWVVIDLGISVALRAAGRTAEADALLDWITGQAELNSWLIPELMHEDDARYFGEVPMVGFGAGAYLLATIARSGTRPPPGGDAGVGPDAAELDAGVSAPDAESDAGIVTMTDAAAPDRDATAANDAARSAPVQSECSCTSTPARSTHSAFDLWSVMAAGVWRRRRRESSPRNTCRAGRSS